MREVQFMGFSMLEAPRASMFGVGALVLALAGCQSGSGTDALEAGGTGQNVAAVRESELRAFCPPVRLREGTAYFNTYQGRAKDDPSKLVYQASIADVTRSCTYGDDTMTINVAVAGRIVPGPAGKTGQINMPIRIAVVSGSEVLYSKLHRVPTSVQDTAGATQFVFNDPAITVPRKGSGVVVFAGYDEGPYDGK